MNNHIKAIPISIKILTLILSTTQIVWAAAHEPTPGAVTYVEEMNVNGIPEEWNWIAPIIKHDVGTTDAQHNDNAVTANTAVTANKADPIVEIPPSASELKYGSQLFDSKLGGGVVRGVDGELLAGEWTWYRDSTVPDGGQNQTIPSLGTNTYPAQFVPYDIVHYNSIVADVAVTVTRIIIDSDVPVNPPTASNITYRQSLADSALRNGAVGGVNGAWTWADPTVVPPAGIHYFEVVFTPDDLEYCEPYTTSISVKVSKATPVLTDEDTPHASDITYGHSIGDSVLTVGRKAK